MRKSNNVGMRKPNEFMNDFMEKLNNGTFKKEVCPNTTPDFVPTKENIKKELESYYSLLKSGIIDEAVKEEKGPVLIKK